MFRKNHIRFVNIACVLFFLSILFTGCDGRYRVFEKPDYKSSTPALNDENLNTVKLIPESDIISVTDTIINPNLKVSIKYFSIKNALISTKNNNGQEEYYREFKSEISIYNHDKLTVKDFISKEDFSTFEHADFWKFAILQYVWLDEYETTKNKISINCSFLIPNTETYKTYKIYFNHEGERNIKLIASS